MYCRCSANSTELPFFGERWRPEMKPYFIVRPKSSQREIVAVVFAGSHFMYEGALFFIASEGL